MMNDSYKTISKESYGEYREKGSKFFCYLFPVQHKDDILKAMESVKKQHPKARHFCYAYGLGINFEPNMSNDDGEPSGSAGRPILGQIKSHELSDTLAIVVRYFGGTKLGIPGLIRAYKAATKEAILANDIIEKILTRTFVLSTGYDQMGTLLEAAKKAKLKIIDKNFESEVRLTFEIPLSDVDQIIHKLKAYLLGINPKELIEDLDPPGVEIIEI